MSHRVDHHVMTWTSWTISESQRNVIKWANFSDCRPRWRLLTFARVCGGWWVRLCVLLDKKNRWEKWERCEGIKRNSLWKQIVQKKKKEKMWFYVTWNRNGLEPSMLADGATFKSCLPFRRLFMGREKSRVVLSANAHHKRLKSSMALSVWFWTASNKKKKETYTHVHKRHITDLRYRLIFRCKVPFYKKFGLSRMKREWEREKPVTSPLAA